MRMTKNKKFEDLNNTFNVSGEIVETEKVVESKIEEIASVSNDIKGQEAINGILELAQESEMPRAYEVAGQLIKNVADATDKLMELQKKLKEVEEEKTSKGPTTVNNALFVGSTADLAKLIKNHDLNALKED